MKRKGFVTLKVGFQRTSSPGEGVLGRGHKGPEMGHPGGGCVVKPLFPTLYSAH